MGTTNGNASPAIINKILIEPYQFDFFQLLRLLNLFYQHHEKVGVECEKIREIARLLVSPSLTYPATAVRSLVHKPKEKIPFDIEVRFPGFFGALGELPREVTVQVLQQLRSEGPQGAVLKDFLDMFHHRLLSLLYRFWEKYHLPMSYERRRRVGGTSDTFSRALLALTGFGSQSLREKAGIDDELLLSYAKHFAHLPRSASTLAGLLSDYLDVPVSVQQCIGRWVALETQQLTHLGTSRAQHRLGDTALLGTRTWIPNTKFRLLIGPLSYAQLVQFLPIGTAYLPLIKLTRMFVGHQYDFDIQLMLKAGEAPHCQLGDTTEPAPRLGWTSWVQNQRDTNNSVIDPVTLTSLDVKKQVYPSKVDQHQT